MPLAFFRKISAERYAIVFVAKGVTLEVKGLSKKER